MRNLDWVLVGQLAQAERRASHMRRPQVAAGVVRDTTDLEAYWLTRNPDVVAAGFGAALRTIGKAERRGWGRAGQ
jgi:hypothetical protein